MSISSSKLDFWIKNNLNVLLIGKHGVGKTTMVVEAFERAKIKWKYFSASTMDPWVDFIGVPRAVEIEGKQYLDLVRPREFQEDEIEAIFFDEYNRAHKKVRNAVMELIQFKSINGKKFSNLRFIWAAINPDDDEVISYDVEALDPAQKDRFQIHFPLPYEPSLEYFSKKYGRHTGKSVIKWWKDLNKEQKNVVSPRRLDYAIDFNVKGGDVRDVFPNTINVHELMLAIKLGPVEEILDKFVSSNQIEEARIWLKEENNYKFAINNIMQNEKFVRFFLPLLEEEKIASIISSKYKSKIGGSLDIVQYTVTHLEIPAFKSVIDGILKSKLNRNLCSKISRLLRRTKKDRVEKVETFNKTVGDFESPLYFRGDELSRDLFKTTLKHSSSLFHLRNTYSRKELYLDLLHSLPENTDYSTAIKVINFLNVLCSKSHNKNFNELPNIVEFFNHFLKIIVDHIKISGKDFWMKYPGNKLNALQRWVTMNEKVSRSFYHNFILQQAQPQQAQPQQPQTQQPQTQQPQTQQPQTEKTWVKA